MNTTPQICDQLERDLVSLLNERSLDLTFGGTVSVERVPSPRKDEVPRLSYYLQSGPESITGCQMTIQVTASELEVELEITIKKFLKPTLSISSAHVAVLLHLLKKRVGSLALPNNKEISSWEINRAQRRAKLINKPILKLTDIPGLLLAVAEIVFDLGKLSEEILREEVEYACAIERWEYAKRSLLILHTVSPLSALQLNRLLSILHSLRDWQGCVSILTESAHRFGGIEGSRYAHAASILYKDVLLNRDRALSLNELAIELDPENELYLVLRQSLKDDLVASPEAQSSISAPEELESQLTPIIPDSPEREVRELEEEEDSFFDDLSFEITSSEQELYVTQATEDESTPIETIASSVTLSEDEASSNHHMLPPEEITQASEEPSELADEEASVLELGEATSDPEANEEGDSSSLSTAPRKRRQGGRKGGRKIKSKTKKGKRSGHR